MTSSRTAAAELGDDYAAAWTEWTEGEDAVLWDATSGDGLSTPKIRSVDAVRVGPVIGRLPPPLLDELDVAIRLRLNV